MRSRIVRLPSRGGDSAGITAGSSWVTRCVAAAILGLILAAAGAGTASAAASEEQCSKLVASISALPAPDPSTLPAECRELFEQQQGQAPAPSPSASQSPSEKPSPAVKPAVEESAEPKVFKDVAPATSAEEWSVEAGRSVDELLGEINRALSDSPKTLDKGFATPYAVAWGIGLVLMAFVITVTAGQAGGGPERRAQLQSAGWRAWTFYPAMLVAPTVAYELYAMAGHLAGWFGGQGENARTLVLRMVSQRLWEASAPAMLLGGGTLMALFMLGLIAAFALLTLVEVALAKYALFLLLCFVPPMAALAIHPRFRPALSRLIGAIVGALLVPPVLQFSFWVSMSIASDTLNAEQLGKEDTLTAFALVLVCLIVASVVPLLMATVMPKVVAGFTNGDEGVSGSRRGLGDLGRSARREGGMAADRLARSSGRGARSRMSASPAGGQIAASAAKNASAGAVTKAAAAASGPAAPVTAAGAAALGAGVGAMRSAYSSAKSKLGGGRGSGGPSGSGPAGGGAGGVGRVPAAPASGSGRPTTGGDTAGQGAGRQASRTSATASPAGAGGTATKRAPSFRPPSEGAR